MNFVVRNSSGQELSITVVEQAICTYAYYFQLSMLKYNAENIEIEECSPSSFLYVDSSNRPFRCIDVV